MFNRVDRHYKFIIKTERKTRLESSDEVSGKKKKKKDKSVGFIER